MNIPVRLYRRTRDGAIVETLEPGETGSLLFGAGAALVDSVAESSGVAAYLRQRGSTKAVEKAEVEDKAVDQEDVEDKGIMPERPLSRSPARMSLIVLTPATSRRLTTHGRGGDQWVMPS